MQVIVQGKNLHVTDRLRDYVEKKVAKLDRYLASISEVRVELGTEKTRSYGDRQVAQLTVRAGGAILRAEERSGDIFVAVDMVMDKIKRQIDRYKRKRRDRARGAQAQMSVEPVEEEAEGRIVRTKRFRIAPMDPEEAIEQMELLGHDFFVFYNATEGQVNVVYRRRDGNYGLIQPEVG